MVCKNFILLFKYILPTYNTINKFNYFIIIVHLVSLWLYDSCVYFIPTYKNNYEYNAQNVLTFHCVHYYYSNLYNIINMWIVYKLNKFISIFYAIYTNFCDVTIKYIWCFFSEKKFIYAHYMFLKYLKLYILILIQ